MLLDHLFTPHVAQTLKPLRDYQERAKSTLLSEIAMEPALRAIAVAATGAGKTVIMCHLISELIAGGKKVGILVQDLTLINQTVKRLKENGITHVGVIQGKHSGRDDSAPVQVISVQTLAARCGENSKYRRRQKPWQADVYLVDEAHKNSHFLFNMMAEMSDKAFIGFTATPSTKGLGKHYSRLIPIASTQELIDAGWLSDFVCYAPAQAKIEKAVAGVAVRAGEFVQDELAEAVNTKEIVGDILAHWKTYADGLQTLVFCVNRKHAKFVTEIFREAGEAVEYIDGETPDAERTAIFERFEAKETKIIANVGVLAVGFDAYVECLVDAKPTRSKILFVQTWGRNLRPKGGKKAIFLDHAGNALRLGLPNQIRFARLDMGESNKSKKSDEDEKEEPLPVLCPECSCVMPRAATVCTQCGYEKPTISVVKHLPGALVEFGSGRLPDDNDKWREIYAFASELEFIRRERGFKPGWLKFALDERFNINLDWEHAVLKVRPAPPSVATKNWDTARRIRAAKAAKAREARSGVQRYG